MKMKQKSGKKKKINQRCFHHYLPMAQKSSEIIPIMLEHTALDRCHTCGYSAANFL